MVVLKAAANRAVAVASKVRRKPHRQPLPKTISIDRIVVANHYNSIVIYHVAKTRELAEAWIEGYRFRDWDDIPTGRPRLLQDLGVIQEAMRKGSTDTLGLDGDEECWPESEGLGDRE